MFGCGVCAVLTLARSVANVAITTRRVCFIGSANGRLQFGFGVRDGEEEGFGPGPSSMSGVALRLR